MDILFITKTIGCWSILSWKRYGVYYHWIYITIVYYPCWISLIFFGKVQHGKIEQSSSSIFNKTMKAIVDSNAARNSSSFFAELGLSMNHRSFTSCFTNREIQTKLHKTAPALHLKATVYTRLTLRPILAGSDLLI